MEDRCYYNGGNIIVSIQPSLYENEVMVFTTMVAQRAMTMANNPGMMLPVLDKVADMRCEVADICANRLYAAVMCHQSSAGLYALVEGLLWVVPRCSDERRNSLFSAGINVNDDLQSVQRKLITTQEGRYFYDQFVMQEIHNPMVDLMHQFHQIRSNNHLGDNIHATVADIIKKYNELGILPPEKNGSITGLVEKSRRGLSLKIHFFNCIQMVNNLIEESRRKQNPSLTQSVSDLYKKDPIVHAGFQLDNLDGVKVKSQHQENDFLINSSDITISKKKPVKTTAPEVKPRVRSNVLQSLKKSAYATYY